MRTRALVFLGGLLFTAAQATVPQEVGVDELRRRLAQLQEELATEGRELELDRERNQAELSELVAQRRVLAAEVLELQIEQSQLESEGRRLRQQSTESREQAVALAKTSQALQAGSRNLAERLKIHLALIPGQDDPASEAGELAGLAAAQPWDDAVREVPIRVLRILNSTLADAGSVRVQNCRLWTTAGRRESVELLSLGQVAWAYQCADGRRALALSSPADASGYRWSEQLPSQVDASLERAFAAVDSGALMLPLDISGQLRVEHALQDESFAQKLRDGGPIMVPLLALALLALGLIFERVWALFLQNRRDEGRVIRILDACRGGQFAEAEQLAKAGKGAVPRTLATCIRRRDAPAAVQEDAVQEHLLHEMPRLDRFLGGLASLAAVAPLLGLLGTVTGIINTFGIIRSYGNANPALMAGGISEALVTTATGMTIAIPILLVHVLLRSRADQTLNDAERHATTLLNLFTAEPEPATEPGPTGNAKPPSEKASERPRE